MMRISFKEPPLAEEQIRSRALLDQKRKEFTRLNDKRRAEILEEQKASWVRCDTGFDSYGETRIKK